jgi:hypothetical protein
MTAKKIIGTAALATLLLAGSVAAQSTTSSSTDTGTGGTTATTPGTPNTGAGGNVAENMMILTGSALAAVAGAALLRKRNTM